MTKTIPYIAIAALLSFGSTQAVAQSGGAIAGAVIGGTAGSVIGANVDNKGSRSEGAAIGAIAGGTLGYIIGDAIDGDDAKYRRQYSNQAGEYYRHNGQSYRRYRNDKHGYVSIRINNDDPYYHSNGKRRNRVKNSRNKRSSYNNGRARSRGYGY